MPQIDHPTLLERINAMLCDASAAELAGSDGHWQAPMAALNEATKSYADVFGTDGKGFFEQLSVAAMSDGAPEMAQLFKAFQESLSDGSLELIPDQAPAARLVRFVYPVV